jgi:hypothetical protein
MRRRNNTAQPHEPAEGLAQKGLNHEKQSQVDSKLKRPRRRVQTLTGMLRTSPMTGKGRLSNAEGAEDEDPEILHALALA